MQALLAIILVILNIAITFGVSLVVMLYGWGLTAQSWPIIIGGFAIVAVVTIVFSGLAQAIKE